MHDVGTMQVRHAFQQHLHVCLDVLVSQRDLHVLDQLAQVGGHEFKDQNKAEALWKDVVEPDHIFAVEGLKV